MEVCVLVLGGIDQSPRMAYHVRSLSKLSEVKKVHFVGYPGEFAHDEKVKVCQLSEASTSLPKFLYLFSLLYKVVFQVIQLLFTLLFWVGNSEIILVQNPPSIPVLAIVGVVSWLRGIQVIIDWHNLGFTIMSVKYGKRNPLVLVSRIYERVFSHVGHQHICVTNAMKTWLVENFKLPPSKITVLYDKAGTKFYQRSLLEKHRFMYKYDDKIFEKDFGKVPCTRYQTPFTEAVATTGKNKGSKEPLTDYTVDPKSTFKIIEKKTRPFLLVSSTSWTPDEDFSLLLHALILLDQQITIEKTESAYKIICIVTGKGPQKALYEEKIKRLKLDHIHIRTMWLEAEDYPVLLGCADLGVCLHTSSSGLDLPMKVADMFGSGLPVCAVKFNCIGELIEENQNGKIFETPAQLCNNLYQLLENPVEIAKLRENITKKSKEERWEKQWSAKIEPLFEKQNRSAKIYIVYMVVLAAVVARCYWT